MKAVIPVAGVGTMLRPHTHTQPKALVPVAGKSLLSHIIDFLLDGGIREFVIVIGYMGNKIRSHIKEHYGHLDIQIDFVLQEPREGSAHAILTAKSLIDPEESFLIMFGDTIVNCKLNDFLEADHTVIGVKKVDSPGLFGIAEVTQGTHQVKKLIEKPKIPKSNLGLVGIYKISKASLLFDEIEDMIATQHRTNDEYHLTDALMKMLQAGENIRIAEVDSWYDCGKKETLLEANSILLNRPNFPTSDYTDDDETIIIQPVKIGENCVIRHSIIGPDVVVGDNTTINNSIIKNSIIGSFSELSNVILDQSIMGNDTFLRGVSQSLNIGDNTEINLG